MLPGFIEAPINPSPFAPLPYYYAVRGRDIGLYIGVKGGYRLVFGSENVNDQDIRQILWSWRRFAKPLLPELGVIP